MDEMSTLNGRLQGTAAACRNGTDPDCLHFSSSQFNGLYVAHFWVGAVAAFFTGFFVGRVGIFVASCCSAGCLLVGL